MNLHPLLALLGMVLVLCGVVVLQVYVIFFVILKKMGGTVHSDAVFVVSGVIASLFVLGAVLIYL